MKRYDLRKIMKKAWELFKEHSISFSEALHRAWQYFKSLPINAQIISAAKKAAGIIEETKTWYEWKTSGYEVMHGSKALFGCDLIWALKGDGVMYKARFFGRSQVVKA